MGEHSRYSDQPLDFSLSSKGLAITGSTNSAEDLMAFVEKLQALAQFLPTPKEKDTPHG